MGISFSGDLLWKLAQTRMLGIPVFLVLLILIFFVPFLAKYFRWKSTAGPEPKPGMAKNNAPSITGVTLTFFRTWIYLGFAAWILLGAILLVFAGLIILYDLISVLLSSRSFSIGIFSDNLLPIGAGWLLLICGGWSAVYFHKNLDGGIDLIRGNFYLYWKSLIAFCGFLLIILNFSIMGGLLVLVGVGSIWRPFCNFIRGRLLKGETKAEGQRIFRDYEEEAARKPKW